MSRLRSNQQGFSLLEILIAFSILALSLGIVLKIFSAGVRTAQVTGNYTTAMQIAQNLLNQTGSTLPLKIAEFQGNEADIYHWRLRISPQQFVSPALSFDGLPVALFHIIAHVEWDAKHLADERVIELTTWKLATKDE